MEMLSYESFLRPKILVQLSTFTSLNQSNESVEIVKENVHRKMYLWEQSKINFELVSKIDQMYEERPESSQNPWLWETFVEVWSTIYGGKG